MMFFRKTFALVINCGLALAAFDDSCAETLSLLANGGFEDGSAAGWSLEGSNDPRWVISTSTVQSGTFSLLADNFPKAISQDISPTAVSDLREFSFWTFVTANARTDMQVTFTDGTALYQFASPSNQWTQHDVLPLLDAGRIMLGLRVYTFNPNALPGDVDTYYDSFKITAVPEPSAYAMALAGIACGGFSMWRRRKRASRTPSQRDATTCVWVSAHRSPEVRL